MVSSQLRWYTAASPRSSARLFFCQCYRDPRSLHSSPTRRSSDLSMSSLSSTTLAIWRRSRPRMFPSAEKRSMDIIGRKRSEEHTSELQSHVNLVCRLLPEKKKDKKDLYVLAHVNGSLARPLSVVR